MKMDYRCYLPKNHVEMLPCMAAFAVVVETGSFVDASVRLGLTASAVSKQISKLEEALSLRLLERSTRQLKVNAEGAEIYSHCKELLESSANVFRLKDQFLEKPQGLIRIAIPPVLYSMCNQLVPDLLATYPGINVQLISSDGPLDLIAAGVDIGIRITDSPPLGLVARRLFEVDFIVCAADNYLKENGRPMHPSDLQKHNCISIFRTPEIQDWKFFSENETCNVRVQGRYFSESPEAVLNATISGLGVSCLPIRLAQESIAGNKLVPLLSEWRYTGVSQGMAWVLFQPGRHVSQKIRVTADYLVNELRGSGELQ